MGLMDDIKGMNVAKVDEDKGLLVLILNILFPGFGCILAGKVWGDHQSTFIIGIIQVLLYWGGWAFSWIGVGLIATSIGWIWAIWWGFLIYKEAKA